MKHVVPAASAAELVELFGGNTAFTLDLDQAARTKRGDSFVCSPYGIVHALSMACAGARVGRTAGGQHAALQPTTGLRSAEDRQKLEHGSARMLLQAIRVDRGRDERI
jgi:hypothetical protein